MIFINGQLVEECCIQAFQENGIEVHAKNTIIFSFDPIIITVVGRWLCRYVLFRCLLSITSKRPLHRTHRFRSFDFQFEMACHAMTRS